MDYFRFSIIALIFIITGCRAISGEHRDTNEIVMAPGMSIEAENANGIMIITAGKNYKRSLTWAGGTRSVFMIPRKERWFGSLGLYYPGEEEWKIHDGITRAVIEEGILNFSSMEEIKKHIKSYYETNSLTYNDTGLFVFWNKDPGAGGTLSVSIWQFLINGEIPKNIPGSRNNKIRITY